MSSDTSAMGSEWSTLDEYEANRPRRTLAERIVTAAYSAHVSPLAVVGAMGEDPRKGFEMPNLGVRIGERSIIREFATVHGGSLAPTRIGDDCYVMAHSHVGHDCVLHDGAKMATGAILGGHTILHEGANVGLGAVTHQFTTVGAYAMIGMGAVVTKDVPPFEVWVGNPARMVGWNLVGMRRAGFAEEMIALLTTEGATSRWHELWARDAGRRGK